MTWLCVLRHSGRPPLTVPQTPPRAESHVLGNTTQENGWHGDEGKTWAFPHPWHNLTTEVSSVLEAKTVRGPPAHCFLLKLAWKLSSPYPGSPESGLQPVSTWWQTYFCRSWTLGTLEVTCFIDRIKLEFSLVLGSGRRSGVTEQK